MRRWLAVGLIGVSVWLLVRWARSGLIRFAVEGDSMTPTLERGDYLAALRLEGRHIPEGGTLVIVRDPRDGHRDLVKRAMAITADGDLVVLGDNPSQSTDSRHFGPVPRNLVIARVFGRYWPLSRLRLFL